MTTASAVTSRLFREPDRPHRGPALAVERSDSHLSDGEAQLEALIG